MIDNFDLKSFNEIVDMSTSSTNIFPASNSVSRNKATVRDDFPMQTRRKKKSVKIKMY